MSKTCGTLDRQRGPHASESGMATLIMVGMLIAGATLVLFLSQDYVKNNADTLAARIVASSSTNASLNQTGSDANFLAQHPSSTNIQDFSSCAGSQAVQCNIPGQAGPYYCLCHPAFAGSTDQLMTVSLDAAG